MQTITTKVTSIRHLTDKTFVLQFQRKGFQFRAGQYIVVNIPGDKQSREYSVYSGEHDDFIEILVRKIDEGYLSPQLNQLAVGDDIEFKGPFGFFVIPDEQLQNKPLYFISTGTGISPFRSFSRTYSDLNYYLIHGARNINEDYERHEYGDKFVFCASRYSEADYYGRVTNFLQLQKPNTKAAFYICGNAEMINDVSDILEEYGVTPNDIRSEVFF